MDGHLGTTLGDADLSQWGGGQTALHGLGGSVENAIGPTTSPTVLVAHAGSIRIVVIVIILLTTKTARRSGGEGVVVGVVHTGQPSTENQLLEAAGLLLRLPGLPFGDGGLVLERFDLLQGALAAGRLAGLGQFLLEALDEGAVVQHLVDAGVGLDQLGAAGEQQGGAGLLQVQLGGGGAANDGHPGIARQRRLEDAGELGIAKVDVRSAAVGLLAEPHDDPGKGEQTLVDLATLLLPIAGGAGMTDGLTTGLYARVKEERKVL